LDHSHLYYKCQRPELAAHIQPGQNRIIDLGCAEGVLGQGLKQQGLASEVIGIEFVPAAAQVAKTRLDRVICGDIESIDREGLDLGAGTFDYIICGDVLEHLRDPWEVVSWLATRLKPGGKLIASLPNVGHWSVALPLLFKGRWDYQNEGILDKTHLRFFTRRTTLELIGQSGLELRKPEPLLRRKLDKIGNTMTLGIMADAFAFQWLVVGVKK